MRTQINLHSAWLARELRLERETTIITQLKININCFWRYTANNGDDNDDDDDDNDDNDADDDDDNNDMRATKTS